MKIPMAYVIVCVDRKETTISGSNQAKGSHMDTILIIEDDHALAEGLTRALSTDQIQAQSCATLREAEKLLSEQSYNLVILDINLPDGNGFDFLKTIKENYACPVVMLTANDLESDIVAGLEQGADDYITKPFSLAILRARVGAQLRKKESVETHITSPHMIGDYCFDFDRMEFTHAGKSVTLSKTEQKLLRMFVESAGITLARDRLMDAVWTNEAEFVDENALSVAVKRLRDKLDAREQIKTVYGIGYVWVK